MSPIDPRLQEALDGERDPSELPVELREAYTRLIGAAKLLETVPPVSVAARVMAEIRQNPVVHTPEANPGRRFIRWISRPRAITLHLRPAWTVALAAGLAAILLLPTEPGTMRLPTPSAAQGIAEFVGHFPGARSVEVVGSFNDWNRGMLHLRDENHDGIWHGDAVLPAGQHEYMFVVDGERWVPDPLAGRYVDDGFGAGRQNAVLIVRPGEPAPGEDSAK